MRGWFLGVVLAGWAGTAQAEMWRFEDAGGSMNFTDSLDKVPPEFRHTARRHTPQAPQMTPDTAAPGIEAIKAERMRIIATFSPERAKLALERGLLTEEEVQYLVESGALRDTDVGASVRFAQNAAAKAAERSAAANAAQAAEDADTRMLRELAGQSGRAAQIEFAKQAAEDALDPEKVRYSLAGTGALATAMIAAYPFVLRKYNSDSTRRIIRLSFIFIFFIVASTGNFLLFRDQIVSLLQLKQGLTNAPAAAPVPLSKAASANRE